MSAAMAGATRSRSFLLRNLVGAASTSLASTKHSGTVNTIFVLFRGFGYAAMDSVDNSISNATSFAPYDGKLHSILLLRKGSLIRGASTYASSSSNVEFLRGAREQIKDIINKYHCNPILVRLAWHDSGTYDKNVTEWPKCGGANGSIRFPPEINHAANAGLQNALKLIAPVKEKFPDVSFADLFQLASATAVELAGGPKIPMRYGRLDAPGPEDCAKEGNLPAAGPPNPATHLREVFYRMGFDDQEIVALSGAHTLGRSRPERSGWGVACTKYTKEGPGSPGGQSWTAQWLKFDNSYFKEIKEKRDNDLLVLPTDAVLFDDPSFKVYAEKYVKSEDLFFEDYAKAHSKLSELGSKFQPSEGFSIDQ